MSRLDGIIRLYKWELDDKRRVLVELQEEHDTIQNRLDSLHKELEEQSEHANSETGLLMMGAYLNGFRQREEAFLQQLDAKNSEILEQQDIVSEAFSELKTFEIARDKELSRIAEKEAKFEQAEFDELGLQRSVKSSPAGHPDRKS